MQIRLLNLVVMFRLWALCTRQIIEAGSVCGKPKGEKCLEDPTLVRTSSYLFGRQSSRSRRPHEKPRQPMDNIIERLKKHKHTKGPLFDPGTVIPGAFSSEDGCKMNWPDLAPPPEFDTTHVTRYHLHFISIHSYDAKIRSLNTFQFSCMESIYDMYAIYDIEPPFWIIDCGPGETWSIKSETRWKRDSENIEKEPITIKRAECDSYTQKKKLEAAQIHDVEAVNQLLPMQTTCSEIIEPQLSLGSGEIQPAVDSAVPVMVRAQVRSPTEGLARVPQLLIKRRIRSHSAQDLQASGGPSSCRTVRQPHSASTSNLYEKDPEEKEYTIADCIKLFGDSELGWQTKMEPFETFQACVYSPDVEDMELRISIEPDPERPSAE